MSNLIYLVQWQGKNCLCVCHNDHQRFGIGYHFKIFRSQVATGKKVNFTPWLNKESWIMVWTLISDHLNLTFWVVAYGRFDCISFHSGEEVKENILTYFSHNLYWLTDSLTDRQTSRQTGRERDWLIKCTALQYINSNFLKRLVPEFACYQPRSWILGYQLSTYYK